MKMIKGLCVSFIAVAVSWTVAEAISRQDPFQRIFLKLKTGSREKFEAVAVLSKPVAKHPVVIFMHGSGEDLAQSGKELQIFAELGFAAVAFEYNKEDQEKFDHQLTALLDSIEQQPWALPNATAFVGFSLGAQRSLEYLIHHPDRQPELYVRLAGGLPSSVKDDDGSVLSKLNCPVLLAHGEQDHTFPVSDVTQLKELLEQEGAEVATRILPNQSHDFGRDRDLVYRAIAEYCKEKLPLTDYSELLDTELSESEKQRFNEALSRAGKNRRELVEVVQSSSEPELGTLAHVIGGLEDYDLANLSGRWLEEYVENAWQMRRSYAWAKEVPIDVFNDYVADPRFNEEALDSWRIWNQLEHEVKYLHTTEEASNAAYFWMWDQVWLITPEREMTPREILRSGGGSCYELVNLYTCLARSIGIPTRRTAIVWPTLTDMTGVGHAITEIWDVEKEQWHAFDSSSGDRDYNADWLLRVPKGTMLAQRGERGDWRSLQEARWEAMTNSIGLFYPSGEVEITVRQGDAPVPDQRVVVEYWLKGRTFSIGAGLTDEEGKASFTLGQSALHPYRFYVDKPEEAPWIWQAVQADQTYELTLDAGQTSEFDASSTPPPLPFPQWQRGDELGD